MGYFYSNQNVFVDSTYYLIDEHDEEPPEEIDHVK